MNKDLIESWIKDNLGSRNYDLDSTQDKDIVAQWKPCQNLWKSLNGEVYDIRIIYKMNNTGQAKIFTTVEDLSDSIDFDFDSKEFNQKKIDQLMLKIADCFNKGGIYELKLIGNDNFTMKPVKMCKNFT